METYTYPHFPSEVSTVHLALYSSVSNAAELKRRLLEASTLTGKGGEQEREAVKYAFIDAKLITSRLHLQTAVYQAMLAHVQSSLRTKSVHSEVLWALSPSHNISQAFRSFGVSDKSQSLLVVRVCSPTLTPADFETKTGQLIRGELLPLSCLEQFTDWALVCKHYKIINDLPVQAHSEILQPSKIDQLVISSIAMKNVSA